MDAHPVPFAGRPPTTAPALDVVIPGAQKCGTSSLLVALAGHSAVARHPSAEFGPLVDPTADLDEHVAHTYGEADGLLLAKSAGLLHDVGHLSRLKQHSPHVRLVIVLRDPVARMYSAYWFARRSGEETLPSFEEALAAESERALQTGFTARVAYRARSDYLSQLHDAVALFGQDQLKVLLLEDFSADPVSTLSDLQGWLGLPVEQLAVDGRVSNPRTGVRSERVARLLKPQGALAVHARQHLPPGLRRAVRGRLRRINERKTVTPAMDPGLRTTLHEEFAPHNAALASEFGLDLTRWQP